MVKTPFPRDISSMTLIQQFGFVTPIDCKERNVKPSHKCPFSDKLSLFWTTITRTALFSFATDVPLSFLKASEVRWNLTRGIWAFVFAFNCCAPGWIPLLLQREQRVKDLGCSSQTTGLGQHTAEVCTLGAKILFQNVCLTPMPGSLKELLPSYRMNRCLYFYIMIWLWKYTEIKV